MNREILRLAIPNIITTLTVPLLGMVDLAIVGHMGSPVYIGAIALGTMIFNMIYWNFGFLRMGTSGLTAQAYGARQDKEAMHILSRALCIGLSAALLLIVLQYPIRLLVFRIVSGSAEVETVAAQYFHICIWSAPALLSLYAFKGWFIGMQNSKVPMWIAIFMDISNILLSLFFVFVLKMKILGVALGTVCAQYAGLLVAVLFWIRHYRSYAAYFSWKEIFSREKMLSFFKVNADIFLRTLCLIAVFSFIPAAGARMGDDYLSANTLLMQFFTLFSYVMDGFAYAGESLVGKYVGAKNRDGMQKTIRYLFLWGLGLSLLFVGAYAFFGDGLLRLFTDEAAVVAFARRYYGWVLVIPLVSFAAFLWDGILIGATASKLMRNSMFVSTLVFFVVYYSLKSLWGNHALWLAFMCYLAFRGLLQSVFFYRSMRQSGIVCFSAAFPKRIMGIGAGLCLMLTVNAQESTGHALSVYDSSTLAALPLYVSRDVDKGKVQVEEVVRLKLQYLPDSLDSYLSSFPHLRELHLSRLRMKSVPQELFALEQLFVLDLSNNKINYMPPELGHLSQLRVLRLNRNPLAYLPKTISGLEHLEYLDLWSTLIKELPEEIRALDGSLHMVDLRVVMMDAYYQEQMQSLLPHARFLFSSSCGCGH